MSDPWLQLEAWIADAAASGVAEPAAMSLATVGDGGRPSARIVLLRGLDERGLCFYTSYDSRKGREISEHPAVAATLVWPAMGRQVRVEGVATQMDDGESDAYFASRPRGHQLAAWASEQSEPLDARDALEERYAHFAERFEGEDVPRPHSWGGYRIVPERFEFWQARPNRMHDREVFVRDGNGWRIERLQP